ncbi:MAG TPA: hypothetical protein VHT70_02565 [Candidatus Saccharimonadales bacterium]|jgi:hypothetical protein|nr:hypothetical protein [Candidatus Saccharimonadales bacterium]
MIQTLLINAHLFAAGSAVANCPEGDTSCDTGLPLSTAGSGSIHTALQITFGVLAVVAVVVIVLAGFRLVITQGDSQAVAKARQTIIYAVVGLMIALSAELIVSFVLNRF